MMKPHKNHTNHLMQLHEDLEDGVHHRLESATGQGHHTLGAQMEHVLSHAQGGTANSGTRPCAHAQHRRQTVNALHGPSTKHVLSYIQGEAAHSGTRSCAHAQHRRPHKATVDATITCKCMMISLIKERRERVRTHKVTVDAFMTDCVVMSLTKEEREKARTHRAMVDAFMTDCVAKLTDQRKKE